MKFGERVRDKTTGYTGTFVARVIYMDRAPKIGVQAKLTEEGAIPDIVWLEETQVECINIQETYKLNDLPNRSHTPQQ